MENRDLDVELYEFMHDKIVNAESFENKVCYTLTRDFYPAFQEFAKQAVSGPPEEDPRKALAQMVAGVGKFVTSAIGMTASFATADNASALELAMTVLELARKDLEQQFQERGGKAEAAEIQLLRTMPLQQAVQEIIRRRKEEREKSQNST